MSGVLWAAAPRNACAMVRAASPWFHVAPVLEGETTLPVTALNASAAASANGETLLEFPDNYLLIDLCGEHDRNLAILEDRI